MNKLRFICSSVIFILLAGAMVAQGTTIRDDFRVSQDTRLTARILPQVAFDDKGNFVVVWSDYPPNSDFRQCYYQRFDSLGNFIGPTVLFSDTSTYYWNGMPSVAMRGDGGFVVAWASALEVMPGKFESDIWVQLYDPMGVPMATKIQVDIDRPTVFEDPLAQESAPKIAMDSLGNFVVVWETQDYLIGHGAWGQLFNSAGERVGNNFLISDPTGSGIDFNPLAQRPQVNMSKEGEFIASWFGDAYSQSRHIRTVPVARSYKADGTPLTPMVGLVDIEAEPLRWGGYCNSAYLPNGNIVIVWEANNPGDTQAFTVPWVGVFDSLLNPVSGPVVASDVSILSIHDFLPVVSCRSDGSFVVVWPDNRNGQGNLWAQRFDASGSPVGRNYRINTGLNSVGSWLGDAWFDIHQNKVVFVWVDTRNSETYGRDIMGKLVEFDDIGIYLPGDVNLDSQTKLSDIIQLVNYLFKGQQIYPLLPADVNADCRVTLVDVILIVNHLFKGWTLQEGCAY